MYHCANIGGYRLFTDTDNIKKVKVKVKYKIYSLIPQPINIILYHEFGEARNAKKDRREGL